MKHGERMDNYDPQWAESEPRPWDPPLTDDGKLQAWRTGQKLRREGGNITRVFCSPFLHCVQTAAEVVTALCVTDDHANAPSSKDVVIDPSKVKVSIEIGLCDVRIKVTRMNTVYLMLDSSGATITEIRSLFEKDSISAMNKVSPSQGFHDFFL
ncbi:uncharacterized protein LOC131079794 [Cryptomeria japonica]|uniref:uncharacterized protein LOC131079794 n=1 Tax=Cryptomeria japonica TaxID=3369 RepID=UPI0027DA1869|nr:uncharacterized protein LOC131079794 [Cryptomeria japonica]